MMASFTAPASYGSSAQTQHSHTHRHSRSHQRKAAPEQLPTTRHKPTASAPFFSSTPRQAFAEDPIDEEHMMSLQNGFPSPGLPHLHSDQVMESMSQNYSNHIHNHLPPNSDHNHDAWSHNPSVPGTTGEHIHFRLVIMICMYVNTNFK
jgi:hypothetical protein